MGRSLHAKIPSTGGALGSTALGIGQFEGSGKVEKTVIYDVNHDLEYVGSPPCFSPHMEDLRDAILAWAQAGAGEPWHILQPFTMRLLGGVSPSKPRGWAPQIAS